MTTKATILARGLGTRMRQADAAAVLDPEQARVADAGVKAMIPIGRPFLDYVISALADAGITDVCLVIGPEHGAVRDYYEREVSLTRVRVHFAIQLEPRGTADAVAAAESFADGATTLVLNADNYYPVEAYRLLATAGGSALIGFDAEALVREGNIDAARIAKFALVRANADGWLEEIVEKPDASTVARLGARAPVSMNVWAFTSVIFEACRRVRPSARGELELQDAVRIAMSELGEPFRVIPYSGAVLDLSSRRDIEEVKARLQGSTVTL